jgi:hypothetical protein
VRPGEALHDTGDDSHPQLTTYGQGNWPAACSCSDDLGGTIGIDDGILFSRSTDNEASSSNASAAMTRYGSTRIGRVQLTEKVLLKGFRLRQVLTCSAGQSARNRLDYFVKWFIGLVPVRRRFGGLTVGWITEAAS